jgi:hypothetical protein
MNDLRLYLLGRATRPTSANDQILSRSAGPHDAVGARLHRMADPRQGRTDLASDAAALDVTPERIVASIHRRPLERSGGLRTTKR